MAELVGDWAIDARRCPIGPGLTVGKYFWKLFGPTVRESGPPVRVAGGFVVPVQYGNGTCALLRHWMGDGVVSIDTVNEIDFPDKRIAQLIRYSKKLPRVIDGSDRKVLYVQVEHDDHFDECMYELRLKGILGPRLDASDVDEYAVCYSTAMDKE